ncbi:hypothetical protein Goklo_007597 [Gossypium klotzschianum]|uniref:C2 domain-containing protein n=1 Tax=Gossypium klotzschianum TaxID=34286 RepID=A0A7J8UXQ2_9ROSI|nr:hypothetical protein [Gossypium klotzschianum]
MEQKPLELTVVSAEGLKKVKHLSKMDVYVVVKVSGGESTTEQKTPVHKDGGTSPKWNHPMVFSFNESLAQTNTTDLAITFRLMCCRTFRGDKEIGEARVPIKELLDGAGNGNSAKYTTYPVKKPSGKAKGKLNFVYRFGEKAANAVPAYPLVMTAMNPLYPPSHNAAVPAYPTVGYSYPPLGFQQLPVQEAYKPAPQPPAGYPPPERKNESGDGLTLGAAALVGGLLGGILLGDMVSDAAASYEAGCDPYANAADYI